MKNRAVWVKDQEGSVKKRAAWSLVSDAVSRGASVSKALPNGTRLEHDASRSPMPSSLRARGNPGLALGLTLNAFSSAFSA